jgi:hypothetical protein
MRDVLYHQKWFDVCDDGVSGANLRSRAAKARPFLICAPGMAHSLGGAEESSSYSTTRPTGGSVSRTARVPVGRRDLKEAAGKALARRTGSV